MTNIFREDTQNPNIGIELLPTNTDNVQDITALAVILLLDIALVLYLVNLL